MKTIVVTGASAGIGLAIADRFAQEKWAVAIIARDPARLDAAKAKLEKRGAKILAIPADVADAAAIDAAALQVIEETGRIDAWVNNAMATILAPADQITPEEYARVTATTYLSQVHGSLAALSHMRTGGRGAIVQISSALAIRPAPLQAAYCAAKAAVGGFTDALRAELIAEKSPITLSTVFLPAVDTPQPRWSRLRTGHRQVIPDPLFDPRLCAEAVYATVKSPRREIWVGRSTVQMAIARTLFPGYSDRVAADMREAQLGAPSADRAGNLDEASKGPAEIDGDGGERTIRNRKEYWTSRSRDGLLVAALAGTLGAGAMAGLGLSRLVARQGR